MSANPAAAASTDEDSQGLVVTFLLMVVVGSVNKIFFKLQTVPMYNYPNFLNLMNCFLFVPICFAYIIPVAKYGLPGATANGERIRPITEEHMNMSKKPFAIMGLLDGCSMILQTFASINLPGPLLILLPQAAIPISMALSRKIMGETYAVSQYIGATIVAMGIVTVLMPMFTDSGASDHQELRCVAYDMEDNCYICEDETNANACLSHMDELSGQVMCQWTSDVSGAAEDNDDAANSSLFWSGIMILSCIPMTLSSIYKELALGGENNGMMELDPVFLNGWVALFQFMFALVLAVPAGMASEPPVEPQDLPQNLWDGFKCYTGTGSIFTGCHPDDHCSTEAALFVNIYLGVNLIYNLLVVLILKYGSSNILYLASTIMVPVGNLAFTLPFMPDPSVLRITDILGLAVIMLGLSVYRFGQDIVNKLSNGAAVANGDSSAGDNDDATTVAYVEFLDDESSSSTTINNNTSFAE
uniref:EamA domain-containing protein n=1 Tax=Leptocylindrus danicus TaxID=163516 RepID=A0A7S2K7X9_9STRA